MILAGKKALVTGGSGAIGRAIAIALAREGADIALTYRQNRKAAEETAESIGALDREALVLRVNLAERDGIEELFARIEEAWGRLDVLVSNAVSATLRPAVDLPSRHWDYVLSANLTAFFECARRSVRLMGDGPGNIIAISSLGSQRVAPGYAALGVAKAGIETLTRYLAVELAGAGINVNAVSPGLVDTRALEAFESVVPDIEDYKRELIEQTPTGQICTPAEVAKVVTFLCSPDAAWIRGQTIVVDGGLSLGI